MVFIFWGFFICFFKENRSLLGLPIRQRRGYSDIPFMESKLTPKVHLSPISHILASPFLFQKIEMLRFQLSSSMDDDLEYSYYISTDLKQQCLREM